MTSLILVCSCLIQFSDPSEVFRSYRWGHSKNFAAYRLEDFDFDHAVEDWVMTQVVGDANGYLSLEFYREHLPRVVSNNVKLIYTGDYKPYQAAVRNLSRLDPSEMHWVFWLLRSSHSQVRVAAVQAMRLAHACKECGGLGVCSQFIARTEPGREDSCRVCELWVGAHEYQSDRGLSCVWCDGLGVFGRR